MIGTLAEIPVVLIVLCMTETAVSLLIANLGHVQLLLGIALKDVAPWIMIWIAIMGIVRLFGRGESTNDTDETEIDDPDSDPYDDFEDEV